MLLWNENESTNAYRRISVTPIPLLWIGVSPNNFLKIDFFFLFVYNTRYIRYRTLLCYGIGYGIVLMLDVFGFSTETRCFLFWSPLPLASDCHFIECQLSRSRLSVESEFTRTSVEYAYGQTVSFGSIRDWDDRRCQANSTTNKFTAQVQRTKVNVHVNRLIGAKVNLNINERSWHDGRRKIPQNTDDRSGSLLLRPGAPLRWTKYSGGPPERS